MKRIATIITLAAIAATPTLGNAAPAKVATYYFEGQTCDASSTTGALSPTKGAGGECTVVGGGEAGISPWSYSTKKGISLKLDVARKMTGTIFVHTNFAVTLAPPIPGYVEATVVFKIGTTKVGEVKVAGVTPPAGDLSVPFELALPATLKNVKATKVSADVTFQKCTGLCTISSTGANVANVSIPVK